MVFQGLLLSITKINFFRLKLLHKSTDLVTHLLVSRRPDLNSLYKLLNVSKRIELIKRLCYQTFNLLKSAYKCLDLVQTLYILMNNYLKCLDCFVQSEIFLLQQGEELINHCVDPDSDFQSMQILA